MLTMSTALMMPAPNTMTMPASAAVPKVEAGAKITLNNHNNAPANKAGKTYKLYSVALSSAAW